MKVEIRRGDLQLALEGGTIVLELRGRRLPWTIQLDGVARVVTRPRGGADPSHEVRLDALTLRRLSPARAQWIGEVGSAGVALEIELNPEGVWFSACPIGTGANEVVAATWPGEISVSGADREACWGNTCQGAMFRADGKPWEFRTDLTGMRLAGLTADGRSLAIIADTPMDNRVRFADDGAGRMSARVTFEPSLGTLAYPRRLLLKPLDAGGHVAIANAFRDYAQRRGLWKSWDERIAENPNVERLKGAFVACAGYFQDDGADQVGVMKKMRALGFARGWLFSPKLLTIGTDWQILDARPNRMTDAEIREIQSLGYIAAPFLQVEESGPSVGMDKFAVDSRGEKYLRWEVGEKKYWEIAKHHVLAALPQFDDMVEECLAIHFDTLMAVGMVEHWGERAYDRRGDAELKCAVAEYYRRRGKIIGAEQRRDWGTRSVELGTGRNWMPVYPRAKRHWPMPLGDLVYHDSVIQSSWEHDAWDDPHPAKSPFIRKYHAFAQELSDLLAASPPVLFPEGMLYLYEAEEYTLEDGTVELRPLRGRPPRLYTKRFTDPETQAALPRALRVCRINERHGFARMTAHRFVDPASPYVQESEFSTGLHVVVNFGDEPFTLPSGRSIAARSAVTEE